MKTLFIWIIAGLSVCMSLQAQGYGNGRGGGYGGYRGNRSGANQGAMRNQSQTIKKDYDQIRIIDFPKITGLTLQQDLDLTSAVTNEHKSILKLTDQKQELQVKIDQAKNQKEADKNTKKMAKIDDKIQKISLKAEQKIRSILSDDQYKEFIEKKDQIKFGIQPNYEKKFLPPQPDNN